MAKAKTITKKNWIEKTDWTAERDALPFFNKGKRGQSANWWDVKPSGNYTADLETVRLYARAFMPPLLINAGPAMLGWIINGMALAGTDRKGRAIDSIATGFLLEIGGSLQTAIANLAMAAVAIEQPKSTLGPAFIARVKSGDAMRSMRTGTLDRHPDGSIFASEAVR